MSLQSTCPTCDANITLPENTVESERLACNECHNFFVVDKIADGKVTLIEAPAVEEDWGE